jgi:dephospho-CoA kinase
MTYFIIIRGPLGIGKSTIARYLAETIGGEYFSIDDLLKEHNLDNIDKNEACIPARNFIKATKFILSRARECLENKQIVIFDGNFYHKEQIEDLIENLSKYQHFIFTLSAPLDICIDRDKKRKNTYGEGAAIAVYNLVSKVKYGINIETNNNSIEEVTNMILSYLPKH